MSSKDQNLSKHDKKALEGASGLKIGIVTSEWNPTICQALLKGARKVLSEAEIPDSQIHAIQVPGSFELPMAAAMLMKSTKLDAVICLGCVIKGETRHDEYINQAIATGITQLSVMSGKPVIFGVLTTEDMAQAKDRSGGKHGNKGIEAAVTAIKMAKLANELTSPKSSIGFS